MHCGSFYGKYNKLPMDGDTITRELEHSGDDEDYLSDLDEEFRDLSSEEDNGVNQVSRAEPSYKKTRSSVRTLSVDSEDSEEDIGVERTERHVIKSDSDSDSETNFDVGGGSGCALTVYSSLTIPKN
jgi:hypothetical protein